ncbi:CDP-glycerol glycerophosphotransferase family protein [Amphibacillus cookii]|uniref:CDP-glycerol glycerophosphotransferase family protein n=1 Tax=Amphibacillus cookii TaxID=767787 RepID=UPI00195B0F36|nr:CDP-glycerol glycerophosphotransferase family protein [Amphibacillus cookii]MBM7543083.1 CDP-glycerol glycerophosphotransferase (TagB/SpsB family) [Amphibacillus cookii]
MYAKLNKVTYDQQSIKLQGQYNINALDPTGIKLVKRKSEITSTYLINHASDQTWTALIDINAFHIDNGKWDLYLIGDQFDPIRVSVDKNFADSRFPIIINSQLGKQFICYSTKYQNCSIQLTQLPICLENYTTVVNEEKSIVVKGTLSSDLIDIHNIKGIDLLIYPKKDPTQYFVITVNISTNQDSLSIMFNLLYSQLIDMSHLSKGKWNIDILIKENNRTFKAKLFVKDEQIKPNTSLLIEQDTLKKVYLYSTINDYLSLGVEKIKISNDLSLCQFNKSHLKIQGYAYLKGLPQDNSYECKRKLIIRDRASGAILYDEPLSQTNHLTFNDQHKHYPKAEFAIDIPLKSLLPKLGLGHHIIDIWVAFDYRSYHFTQKIGFTDHDYKKDYFEQYHKTLINNRVSMTYIATTPYGNIKLLNYTHSIVNYLILKSEKILYQFSKRQIWLIGERQDTAQDNGYHFFKYCRENHPEIDVYYIIDKSSKDYKRVDPLGNVVSYGSSKHYRLACQATNFIGTHDLEYILPIPGFELTSYRKGNRIFLQHGVLGRKNVEYHRNYYVHPFNLFFVSSKEEKKLVQQKYFYPIDDIKITGLSRFDALKHNNQSKNSILLIPTWREWITTEKQFLESTYFKRYLDLVTNTKLNDLLERHNITIDFYPHYRMQPYIKHFESINNKSINIIKIGDVHVHDLIKQNQLMITDYSSVSFDFSYMSKPIIFYHFDFDRFFKKGILRPVEDTFLGDIANNEEQLIDFIEEYIERDFKEKSKVTDNKEIILEHIDAKNNERIYNEIIERLNKQ